MNNSPIGLFDSGFGGLSVWVAIRRHLPHESLIYLGDGANCPYGSRSCEEVVQLSLRAVEQLIGLGCKLIVIACNTATAAAIETIRAKFPHIDIVGIEPAVKPACLKSVSRKVGVLATERSLAGGHFQRSITKYGSDVEIVPLFGRGFVELVEGNMEDTPEAERVVRKVIEPMISRGVDQIVLGCTHYPFLLPIIRRVVGEEVNIIDPAPAVARRVEQLLKDRDALAESDNMAECEFITYADEEYRQRLIAKAEQIIKRV